MMPTCPWSALLPVTGEPWRGVRYGCTTRVGGISTGPWGALNLGLHVGDCPQTVAENRRLLVDVLPGEPLWLQQVHGTGVVDADGTFPGDPPRADAAITTQRGRVLAIMTADCLPVVIADMGGRALGLAHAGWRGLAEGVLESTLAALRARLPHADGWRAWLGPCIGQARFEVGDEVRQAFLCKDPATAECFRPAGAPGKWLADLTGIARHRLATAGVHNVESAGLCTYDRADLFYSYRRSAVCGRMVTLGWLDAESA